MALKQEIILWDEAVRYHDKGELEKSLNTFNEIADTSRILFNCGVIHAALGEHADAVVFYHRAVARDQYLAVAYFQCGVSNFLLGEFEEALANFNDTILCLRGNLHIDYEQLGLKYKLHFCEALFNRGLCYIYLQQKALGMQDLRMASAKKASATHSVIDEAIDEEAEGFVVFSIPRGIVYRPNAAKVKNLSSKDYLGKARLIAAQQERRSQSNRPSMHGRNNSEATVLNDYGRDQALPITRTYPLRPGLSSRSRQQSEPPLNRSNMFPPTPPPEEAMHKRPRSSDGKRDSISGSSDCSAKGSQLEDQKVRSKPSKLELGSAAFPFRSQQGPVEAESKPRLGTVRSASEQPRARFDGPGTSARREIGERREINRRSLRVDTLEDNYTLKPSVYDAVDRTLSQSKHPAERKLGEHERQQPPLLQPVTYNQQRSKSKARFDTQRPKSIEEEDCEDEEAHPDSAVSGIPPSSSSTMNGTFTPSTASTGGYEEGLLPFEIVAPPGHPHHIPRPVQPPPQVELGKIRVKVHGERDTRYVMILPSCTFVEFVGNIQKKFGLLCGEASQDKTGEFKLKVRDEEGDMVTMGDQEDLDMAIQSVRDGLSRAVGAVESAPMMGKMEIWVQEV